MSETGNWQTSIAARPGGFDIRNWPLTAARFTRSRPRLGRAQVAVISKTVVTNLFGEESTRSQSIRINRSRLEIPGVAAEKGASPSGRTTATG
jgi:putative ABC transport system permease protein